MYVEPTTGWTNTTPLNGDFFATARKIAQHRRQNPSFGLRSDIASCEAALEEQTIARLIRTGKDSGYVDGVQKKTLVTAFQNLAGRVAGLVEAVKRDVNGARSLAEWLGEGAMPVSQDLAEVRALACRQCPMNGGVVGKVKEAVAEYLQTKAKLELHVEKESELHTCQVCECPLKLKVWVPLDYVLSHSEATQFPAECWIRKEAGAKSAAKLAKRDTVIVSGVPARPRVTIQRKAAIGDIINASGVASALHALGYDVRMAVAKELKGVLENHPHVFEVVEHGSVKPDINLDDAHEKNPLNRERSILDLFLDRADEWLITEKRKRPIARDTVRTTVGVTKAERGAAEAVMAKYAKPWVVVVPKSNGWKNRSTPQGLWKSVSRQLGAASLFWTGTDRIDGGPVDLRCKSIRQVIGAIASADLVVTVDTGPMHIAAALGKPILAIQQAFDLALRLPPWADWESFNPDVDCLKCGEYRCPIDHADPPCTHLDPAKLSQAISKRLRGTQGSAGTDPVRVTHTVYPGRSQFYHAGDLGDIIYACPTIRALGGGTLFLGPATVDSVRDPMTPAKALSVRSLLIRQPYIDDVVYVTAKPDSIDYDLNQMRSVFRSSKWHPRMNLSENHSEAFGLPSNLTDKQWLTVSPNPECFGRVVINRTARYQNPQFNWGELVSKLGNRLLFIGSNSEHAEFCKQFGSVEHLKTDNLLGVARAIAGADLFIGNQSCPRAIAEGLKAPCVMEGYDKIRNCHFERPGNTNIYGNEPLKIELPPKRKRPAPAIISGIVDAFSGFGQTFQYWMTGLNERGWNIAVLPTRRSDTFAPISPAMEKLIVKTGIPSVVMETHGFLPKSLGSDQVVISMWEAPRIDAEIVDALNRARCLIVPSTWCATSYSASGVTVPIRIVPLPINTDIFTRSRPPGSDGLVSFGCSGRYSHGPLRKGLKSAEEAFKMAFPSQRDVRLNMKVFEDCQIESSDQRVVLERRFIKDSELAGWYRGNLAHVSTCRSGAWELQTLQAMGVGCCPIALKWSGPTDYLEVGRFPDFVLHPCQDGELKGHGVWAEPCLDSVASHMRWVYQNRQQAMRLGEQASEVAKRYSVRRSVERLEQVLIEFGVLP